MKSFDPSSFTTPKAKPLPVILLLDCSGSMKGEKIRTLNEAIRDMLGELQDTEAGENEIQLSIISFGSDVSLHQKLTPVEKIHWENLCAGGLTPLGVTLQMAKAMIEDREVIPSRAYRPTVVLVSDGHPTDEWEKPLDDFVSGGRSEKCDRMAMAIGAKADESVLGRFIENTQNPLFYAEDAKQLRDFFKFVTMSVTSRTQSLNPNALPEIHSIEEKPATIEKRRSWGQTISESQAPEKIIDEQPDKEGYW